MPHTSASWLSTFGVLLLAGCSDYAFWGRERERGPDGEGGWNPVDTGAADVAGDETGVGEVQIENPETDAAFNVAYQYSAFGSQTGRCQVEIAFFQPQSNDGTGGSSGQSIAMPEGPGECAFTEFEPTEDVANGSMNVRGTWSAGDALTLSDAADLLLPAVPHDDGTITYALADCRHETFPFARAFDLSGPGNEGGMAPFDLPLAVAVGPDLVRVLPTDDQLDVGILNQSVSEAMEWAWDYAQEPPETAQGPMTRSEMFLLRNTRRSDNFTMQAIACQPDGSGSLIVPVDMMSRLTPDPGDSSLYAAAQVDIVWSGGDVETPWGQLVRVQSLLTLSGELRLSP